MKSNLKLVFIKLLIISNILIWFSSCSTGVNNIRKSDDSNYILGHWVIDLEKFELALMEEALNSPPVLSGEKTFEEVKFGVSMVIEMQKQYYIIFSENTFEEYNPMGETSTGKWEIKNNQLIRDYNINDMLRQSIESFDKFKPIIEDFENPKDFEAEIENHNNLKNDMLKGLNQVSPYTLSKNKLFIKVKTEDFRRGSMIIPFYLKRISSSN